MRSAFYGPRELPKKLCLQDLSSSRALMGERPCCSSTILAVSSGSTGTQLLKSRANRRIEKQLCEVIILAEDSFRCYLFSLQRGSCRFRFIISYRIIHIPKSQP